MKLSTILFLVCGCIISTGCVHQAKMNYVNGYAYMVHDDNCRSVTQSPQQKERLCISCYDKNGNYTGERKAMSKAEVESYQLNQQLKVMRDIQIQNEVYYRSLYNRWNYPPPPPPNPYYPPPRW